MSPTHVAAPATSLKQHQLYASIDSAALRVAVTLPFPAPGHAGLGVRLWWRGSPVTAREVAIGFSRPLQRGMRMQVMKRNGDAYRADVAIRGTGIWEALLRIRAAPHQPRPATVAFLLRVWSATSADLYPLFAPVNGWRSSVSMPFGPYAAQVRVAVGAYGASRFRIQLRAMGTHPTYPPRLRLELTMLDMAMGRTDIAARPAQRGVYTAPAFLSMAGIWGVALQTGGAHAAAALVIGLPQG